MEMLRERLAPGVENRGDADRAAKVPWVTTEGEQGVGGRAKQQRVDHPRIALGERVEFVRQFGVRRRSKSARPFIVATWRVRYLDLAVAP